MTPEYPKLFVSSVYISTYRDIFQKEEVRPNELGVKTYCFYYDLINYTSSTADNICKVQEHSFYLL